MKNKIKQNKILVISIIAVIILICMIAGGTYAFFAAQVSSSQYIAGTSAFSDENIKLEITQVSSGTGKLIPQLDSAIQKAVTGANGKGSCIDDNGNTICKVYKIVVTNLTEVSIKFETILELTADNMENLKWAEGTSASSGFPTSEGIHPKSYINLDDNALEPKGNSNSSITYYVVIWISETTTMQNDRNDFIGTVSVNTYTIGADGSKIGGITSTFTG